MNVRRLLNFMWNTIPSLTALSYRSEFSEEDETSQEILKSFPSPQRTNKRLVINNYRF